MTTATLDLLEARDDLGMAQQAGWIPPTPAFVVRMLAARRRERRAFARQHH